MSNNGWRQPKEVPLRDEMDLIRGPLAARPEGGRNDFLCTTLRLHGQTIGRAQARWKSEIWHSWLIIERLNSKSMIEK